MTLLVKDQNELCRYMPNVVFSVEGEQDLFDKVLPYLQAQQTVIESRVTGTRHTPGQPGTTVTEALRRAVVAGAMAAALPALDIVLTPNGFGVVSTSEVAPASRERVHALARSLTAAKISNIDIALRELRKDPEWRRTERGRHYCGTLVESLREVIRYSKDDREDLLDTYDRARETAAVFEEKVASAFLGHTVTGLIVSAVDEGREDLYNARTYLTYAERRYISRHWDSHEIIDDFKAELWRICQPVVNAVRRNPQLTEIWAEEMPEMAHPKTFDNDVKGAFYL